MGYRYSEKPVRKPTEILQMTAQFTPRPEDRLTFGLWTVGNPGADIQ